MPLIPRVPTLSSITNRTQAKLGKRPCLLQQKVCEALLRQDKNIVCMALTGFGKTLTFFMPLLFSPKGVMIIVTVLNVLGHQNIAQLESVGISGIALNGSSIPSGTLKVRLTLNYNLCTCSQLKRFRIFEMASIACLL